MCPQWHVYCSLETHSSASWFSFWFSFCVGVRFEKYESESDYRKEYSGDICKDFGQAWIRLLLYRELKV